MFSLGQVLRRMSGEGWIIGEDLLKQHRVVFVKVVGLVICQSYFCCLYNCEKYIVKYQTKLTFYVCNQNHDKNKRLYCNYCHNLVKYVYDLNNL